MFTKTLIAVAALALIASVATPAQAALTQNGKDVNGTELNGRDVNGTELNGGGNNGTELNGGGENGLGTNGGGNNGGGANGGGANGGGTNGVVSSLKGFAIDGIELPAAR